jgi:hypothetical protein
MVRTCWWGSEKEKRKTHSMAWDQIIKPKAMGDLGFRDCRLFNQAMLARQAWRLLLNPVSLCAWVLKAKYYPKAMFARYTASTWQAITYGLEAPQKGVLLSDR